MTAVDGILFLLAIATFFGGLAGMILPSLIKLKSRLTAFGVFLSSIIFPGIGAARASDSEEGVAGIIVLVGFTVLLWGLAWLARQVWRTARQQMRKSPAQATEPAKADRVRQEIEAHHRLVKARKKAQPSAPPSRETRQPAFGPAPPMRAPARPKRSKIEPDRAGMPKALSGESVAFTYVDAEGEITDRQLRNWSRTSQYIEGYCLMRRRVRTFRIDRVLQWSDWT